MTPALTPKQARKGETMLYLIEIETEKSRYMNGSESFSARHIVEARDEVEAKRIIIRHYKNKSDNYGTSYGWISFEVIEPALTAESVGLEPTP